MLKDWISWQGQQISQTPISPYQDYGWSLTLFGVFKFNSIHGCLNDDNNFGSSTAVTQTLAIIFLMDEFIKLFQLQLPNERMFIFNRDGVLLFISFP